MGAWGFAVMSDDTARDVLDVVSCGLKSGMSLAAPLAHAKAKCAEMAADPDEAPVLRMAIAYAQWQWGTVDAGLLDQIRDDIRKGRGLDRWPVGQDRLRRIDALHRFVRKIEVPREKPAAVPKLVRRPAPFLTGDCLSVFRDDGKFGAALILATNNANVEYGMNLVARLEYSGDVPASINMFRARRWAHRRTAFGKRERDISWVLPVAFRAVSARIEVVGNIGRRWWHPSTSNSHSGWKWVVSRPDLCSVGGITSTSTAGQSGMSVPDNSSSESQHL